MENSHFVQRSDLESDYVHLQLMTGEGFCMKKKEYFLVLWSMMKGHDIQIGSLKRLLYKEDYRGGLRVIGHG